MPDGLFSTLMKSLHAPVYRSRLAGMVDLITPHLQPGDRVLDVGCGNGQLGRAIMDAAPESFSGGDEDSVPDHGDSAAWVDVAGLERAPRDGAAIQVTAYDGRTIPFDDNTFDVLIVADVVHHDPDPLHVLRECLRVARRHVMLKDHKVDGPAITLPYPRICLMDWAANVQYGVPCEFDYPTLAGWHQRFAEVGTQAVAEEKRIQLYPRPYRWCFTPRLQYFALLDASTG